MRRTLPLLISMLTIQCSCAVSPPALVCRDGLLAARTGQVWIHTPTELSGKVDEKKGMIPVTKTAFRGDVGWAIDYHLMFIAKSVDKGLTWRTVGTTPHDPMMPWGLWVESAHCAWVWGTYTDETAWNGVPTNVLVTHDGGKTWRGIPHLVDWLYDVEVSSASRAIVVGRERPPNWPKYSNPLTLPASRFETKDGGKTFTKL